MDLLPIVLMVLVPAVAGLGLFAAAAALFTAAARNADTKERSSAVTGGLGVLGGCAALFGCGLLIVSLGVVYCAGIAAPMH